MKQLFEKPHLIFWLSIPLIILIGFLSGIEPLDINFHDTYYVIEQGVISILISFIFGIIGLGYWIMQKTNRKLTKWMNRIHIALTFGGMIVISVIPYIFTSKTDSEIPIFNDLEVINIAITLVVLLIFFGQLIYLSNLIFGMFNKNKTSS